jgi:hypothetical protein
MAKHALKITRERIAQAYVDTFNESPRSIEYLNGSYYVESNELDLGGWPYKYEVLPAISRKHGIAFKGGCL